MKRPVLILLALLLPALFGWGIGQFFGRDPSQPNRELFTEMSHSYAAETQAHDGALQGGRVQHLAPKGTVYRGQLAAGLAWDDEQDHMSYLANGMEAKDLRGPEASDESRALGAKRYLKYCQSCHGDKGQGNPKLTAAGFPQAPNIVAGRASSLTQGEIYEIIVKGQGKMQPMAERIPPKELWAIIDHLSKLQGKAE